MNNSTCISILRKIARWLIVANMAIGSGLPMVHAVPIDQLRQQFVDNFNQGRYIYPSSPDGNILLYEMTSTLGASYESKFLRGLAVGAAFTTMTLNPEAGVGSFAGYTIGSILWNCYTGNCSGDPFIADIVLGQSIIIDGMGDVTNAILDLSNNNIVRTDYLASQPGIDSGASISFIRPDIFNVQLVDSSHALVSQIFGTDSFLLKNGSETLFGYAVYNDPIITGRFVDASDKIHADYSAITSLPLDTNLTLIGSHMVVNELINLPEPSFFSLMSVGLLILFLLRNNLNKGDNGGI